MIISQFARLWLYIGMSILPVWLDFFKLSTDYTLRGMAMPILTSLNAAIIVVLAKTSPPPDTSKVTTTVTPDAVTTTTETEKQQPQPPKA